MMEIEVEALVCTPRDTHETHETHWHHQAHASQLEASLQVSSILSPIERSVICLLTVWRSRFRLLDRHNSLSAILLDALVHELLMEDAEHGGAVRSDVEIVVECASDVGEHQAHRCG